MLDSYRQQSKLKLASTVISIAFVAGLVGLANAIRPATTTSAFKATPTSQMSTGRKEPVANNNSGQASSSGYKDGSYTATSYYYVPHSQEGIQVNLQLSNGIIKDVSVRNTESDPVSASYQEGFASSYKSYVVGQKIDQLNLGTISGASDTTQGFDDAINQIISRAQA